LRFRQLRKLKAPLLAAKLGFERRLRGRDTRQAKKHKDREKPARPGYHYTEH
jgi:hypothetical protein